MTDVTTRPLGSCDGELLRTATWTNINWTGQQRCTYRDIDGTPDIGHYVQLLPGRGDFGIVAHSKGGPVVGLVWLLFLGADDPGYGFVAADVPELSITVWSGYRGEGVGAALLGEALQEARRRGLRQVSLSVEAGNPSVCLYRRLGFRPVRAAADGTYAVDL